MPLKRRRRTKTNKKRNKNKIKKEILIRLRIPFVYIWRFLKKKKKKKSKQKSFDNRLFFFPRALRCFFFTNPLSPCDSKSLMVYRFVPCNFFFPSKKLNDGINHAKWVNKKPGHLLLVFIWIENVIRFYGHFYDFR